MELEKAKHIFTKACRDDLAAEMMAAGRDRSVFITMFLNYICDEAGPKAQGEFVSGLGLMIGGVKSTPDGGCYIDTLEEALLASEEYMRKLETENPEIKPKQVIHLVLAAMRDRTNGIVSYPENISPISAPSKDL